MVGSTKHNMKENKQNTTYPFPKPVRQNMVIYMNRTNLTTSSKYNNEVIPSQQAMKPGKVVCLIIFMHK